MTPTLNLKDLEKNIRARQAAFESIINQFDNETNEKGYESERLRPRSESEKLILRKFEN